MFSDLVNQDMRLVMLRCLGEDSGYAMNESILQSAVEMFGHCVSRDKIRTELRWLEEQGLVHIDVVADVLVAKLTGRGVDCGGGRCRIDGVKVPRPRG